MSSARRGLEAASVKESSVLTFKALLGGQGAAEEMVEALERQSAKLPFTAEQSLGLGRRLLAGGFGAEQIPTLLRTLGDAAAADRPRASRRSTQPSRATPAHPLRGRAEHEHQGRCVRSPTLGVPAGAVYERLGEVFGVTAKRARELVKAGKVDSANALLRHRRAR